jgi:uncharacterized RDD family membrane protein YckC
MTDTASSGGNYAGFWIRVIAYIVDGLVLAIPIVAVTIIFPGVTDPATGVAAGASLIGSLISAAIIIVYVGFMDSSAKQGTVGKMALGLKVTDTSGARLSLGHAIYRAWPYYLAALAGVVDALAGTTPAIAGILGVVALISCIVVAFTAKKQGIHDMMAGTLVVKK